MILFVPDILPVVVGGAAKADVRYVAPHGWRPLLPKCLPPEATWDVDVCVWSLPDGDTAQLMVVGVPFRVQVGWEVAVWLDDLFWQRADGTYLGPLY